MSHHVANGALVWNSSPCSKMACHTRCGHGCSANAWKLDWPWFSACFGTFKAPDGCNWTNHHAQKTGGCPIIAVKACHNPTFFGTGLIGGGDPAHCTFNTSNCATGSHPYYAEANRALMASLGVTRTGSNVYATFSWSG